MSVLYSRPKYLRLLILPALFLTWTATPAAAQDESGKSIYTAGLGIQFKPNYPGADDFQLEPLPVVRVRHQGETLAAQSPDENFSFRLFGPRDGLSFGPALNFQTKRKQSDVGAPVGDVGFTVEPGVFVQGYLAENVRLRAEARHGVGGHNAFVGDISADYVIRPADDRYVATIGPRVRLAEAKYNRRYFGVTPDRAIASGLPAYDPDGGVYSVGAAAGMLYQFTPKWGAFGYAGYDRLIGDAADSPIVRGYGSRNQFSAGLAVTYSFSL